MQINNQLDGGQGFANQAAATAVAGHDAVGTHGLETAQIAYWGDSLTVRISDPSATTNLPRVLSEFAVFMRGVGGDSAAQIKTRFLAEPTLHQANTVIWAGTNGIGDTATVLANVASIVAALGHSRYLVISPFNVTTDIAGSAGYISAMATIAALSAAYGSRYFDLRSWFVAQYNPEVPQDVLDFANDVIPSSLREDTVHPNFAGVALIVPKLAEVIRAAFPAPVGIARALSLPMPAAHLNMARGKLLRDMFPVLASDDLGNLLIGRHTANNQTITTAAANVVIGENSGIALTTGPRNVFIGNFVAYSATSANDCVCVGDRAGSLMTSAWGNVFVSQYAGKNVTTGSATVAIGYSALDLTTTGANIVAVGAYAGSKNTTGSTNTWVGNQAGNGAAQKVDAVNSTAVGNGANTTASNQVVIGNDAVTEMRVGGAGAGIVLKSPNGTAYRITVANGGTITVAAA